MNKKFYNCYSPRMMIFLAEEKILPLNMFFHKDNNRRVWVYEVTEELSDQLRVWTQKKNLK